LRACDYVARMVEDDETRAGRPLIDSPDVAGHDGQGYNGVNLLRAPGL
jgi:hypothetical protein